MASLTFVQALFYVPLLWLLMATQLQSLSLRTWAASLIAILTPYWFALLWLVYIQDFTPLTDHLSELLSFQPPQGAYVNPSPGTILALAIAGTIHFFQRSFEDKIRIRMFYGFFIVMTTVTLLFILAQPQHLHELMPILILCASPLIAHVLTFTSSRLSNILFFVVLTLAAAITVVNLFF